MSMRFSLALAKNPTARLSGAQNGKVASSVPGSGSAASESRRRSQSCRRPLASMAANTTAAPSGEITGGPA